MGGAEGGVAWGRGVLSWVLGLGDPVRSLLFLCLSVPSLATRKDKATERHAGLWQLGLL